MPASPNSSPKLTRLQKRIHHISAKGYAFYESHARAGTAAALPHWNAALPALVQVNAPYQGQSLLTYLIHLLHAPEDRRWVIKILGDMGKEAADAIPALIQHLNDRNPDVQSDAAWALEQLGKAAPDVVLHHVLPCLDHEHFEVRSTAAELLGKVGSKSDNVIGGLLKAMEDHHHKVRRSAVEALGEIGNYSVTIIIALADHLNQKNEEKEVRRSAAVALGKTEPGIPILRDFLNDHVEEWVRRRAVEALGTTEGELATVVPVLLKHWSRDEANMVCWSAAWALGQIGRRSPAEIIPVLLARMNNKNEGDEVRRSAAWALGLIGEKAAEAVPSLLERLQDETETWWIHWRAAEALKQMGPAASASIPFFIRCLQDTNEAEWTRRCAAEGLGCMGTTAPEATEVLVECLQDKYPDVKEKAAEALGKMGARTAVPNLIHCLTDDNYEVCAAAAEALGQMRPVASEAVPALIACLRDDNYRVNKKAAQALGRIGSFDPSSVVSQLIRHLHNGDEWVRSGAADALGVIQKQGKARIFSSHPKVKAWKTRRKSFKSSLKGKFRIKRNFAPPRVIVRAKREKRKLDTGCLLRTEKLSYGYRASRVVLPSLKPEETYSI